MIILHFQNNVKLSTFPTTGAMWIVYVLGTLCKGAVVLDGLCNRNLVPRVLIFDKEISKSVKCFEKNTNVSGLWLSFSVRKTVVYGITYYCTTVFHTLKKGHKPETFVFFWYFFSEYHLISYWSTSITHPWRFFRLTFIHDFKPEGNWKQCLWKHDFKPEGNWKQCLWKHDFKPEGNWKQCLWKVWVQTEFVMEQRVSCEWTHGAPRLRFRIIYRILAKKSVLEFKSPDKNFPHENLSSLS